MTVPSPELSGYTTLPEPDLVFANNKTHKHPLLGLIQHGPYGLKFGSPSKLRLALMAPVADLLRLKGLVSEPALGSPPALHYTKRGISEKERFCVK